MLEVQERQPQLTLGSTAGKRELIESELRKDAGRSDREIARILGCDHKTVGAARERLGIISPVGNSPPASTPTEFRSMLIEAGKNFDAKHPPETAEEAVDNALASGKISHIGAVSGYGKARTVCPPPPGVVDEPEWNPFHPDSDALVIPPQPAIAVYANTAGSVTIRQPCDEYNEEDEIITIRPEHMDKLIARLRKAAAEACE